ncbi:MAG: phosphotransferase [Chromatiales bacterium]|jgi:phosphate uptake regulator/aminoglycoside phosphotransferase (APT) family kinase protein
MSLERSIRENLHFLLTEVASHLVFLKQYLDQPSINIATRVMERQGYVESLRLAIHNHALQQVACTNQESARQRFRSTEIIATQLERIAELCCDAITQGTHLRDTHRLKLKDCLEMLDQVGDALNLVESALLEKETQQALMIGKVEQRLDKAYQKLLKQGIGALKKERHPADCITRILLAQRIEQMGDALLQISEAIISFCMGQHFDTERFHALSASIDELEAVKDLEEVQVVALAQTRSGSAVNALSDSDDVYQAIFKGGRKRKLKEERQRVEDWHEIMPGLAPKILSYQKRGDSAALLIEHLAGETFEQILLHGSDVLLQEAFGQLSKTLKRIWRETRSDKPVCADYIGQLHKRLPDVYAVHPAFEATACAIGGVTLPDFGQQLARLKRLEERIKAPFSVYIHGDFNVDNIIYDPGEERINFIDLHRSRHMDYLQDVSVFLVSCYRLQVFDPRIRRRIQRLCLDFYRFARQYGRRQEDSSFEIRLALGLIRSFATSTRFILDKSLSWAMYNRAVYLAQRLLESEQLDSDFKLPIEEVFVG